MDNQPMIIEFSGNHISKCPSIRGEKTPVPAHMMFSSLNRKQILFNTDYFTPCICVQKNLDKCHPDKCCLGKCPKHLGSSYFCELGLHAKFQPPKLCRSRQKRCPAGGQVGGWFLVENNAPLWLHLASWNLQISALLEIQDGAECGNNHSLVVMISYMIVTIL